jgi:magnesium-transporting ATPase (P-type)
MLVVGVSPLLALQILLINVVSDGIPGFFLAFEKPEQGVMKRKPLSKNSGIFSAGLGARIARGSVCFAILTLGAFFLGAYVLPAPAGIDPSPFSILVGENAAYYTIGISMAFVVLSWASVINIFNVRSELSIFKISPLSNKGLTISAIGTILVTLAVAVIPPLAEIFDIETGLTALHWAVMAGLAVMQLVVGEIHKAIFSNKS